MAQARLVQGFPYALSSNNPVRVNVTRVNLMIGKIFLFLVSFTGAFTGLARITTAQDAAQDLNQNKDAPPKTATVVMARCGNQLPDQRLDQR